LSSTFVFALQSPYISPQVLESSPPPPPSPPLRHIHGRPAVWEPWLLLLPEFHAGG
jgi:hypothetical protein